MMTEQTTPRNNSASLRRALALLLALGGDDVDARGQSLGDLATTVGINKSTAARLVKPLVEARLVERDAVTGHLRLGSRNAQLGQAYLDRLDLRAAAHDTLRSLAADSGETAHLVVAEPPDVVYVDKVDSPLPVRMHSRIGHRQPMYCTAVGKALLAAAAGESREQAVNAVVAAGMPPHTEQTITTRAALLADLAVTDQRGFAMDDVENEPGVRCVAAAIRDHTGAAIAAISISGPQERLTPARADEWGPRVAQAAAAVSRSWGVDS